jgi:hypothetical protein
MLATGEVRGLRIEVLADNQGLRIHPGRCRDSEDTRDMGLDPSDHCEILTARVGLGGLDTGTMQPLTSYAVYLVRQGNDTEGLLSTGFDPDSAEPPAFPNDGSLTYRRIGAIATGADGRIVEVDQNGDERERVYTYRSSPVLALPDAAATVMSPFHLGPFCHRFARRAWLRVSPGNGVSVSIARDAGGSESRLIEAPMTVPLELEGHEEPVGYFRNEKAGGSATISLVSFEELI